MTTPRRIYGYHAHDMLKRRLPLSILAHTRRTPSRHCHDLRKSVFSRHLPRSLGSQQTIQAFIYYSIELLRRYEPSPTQHSSPSMLPPYLLTAILSVIPSTTSLPTDSVASYDPPPYNCGYVLFMRNENVHTSLSALDRCEPVYFNATSKRYLEAFAYHLYGGCECRFFE